MLYTSIFLIGSAAALTFGSFADGTLNTYVKVGADVHSEFKYNSSESNISKKAKGYSIFLENTRNFDKNVELGYGLGFIGRSSKNINFVDKDGATWKGKAPSYNSIPLYLIVKLNLSTDSAFKPYLKADLGYSFNRMKYTIDAGDKKSTAKAVGGLYAGIGFGAEFHNFVADLSYVHTSGKYKWNYGREEKVNNGAVRLSLGYKFNF